MKPKIVILLSLLTVIGGLISFFVCKSIYESKVSRLSKSAKETFVEALNEELQNRKIRGRLSFFFDASNLTSEMPDSVSITDASGKYTYLLDPEKSRLNVTTDSNVRCLHSYIFSKHKHPLEVDSLNCSWNKLLQQSGLSMSSALSISVLDNQGHIDLQTTSESDWCNASHLLFVVYIGYACEIEIKGYLHYSVWNILHFEMLICILIYIVLVCGFYVLCLVVRKKAMNKQHKRIVETPVVRVVKEACDTPVRSYQLHENIIFCAEQKLIIANGVEKKLIAQVSQLLELFLNSRDYGYKLSDDSIKENLWPDGSANQGRVHKAIARLRAVLRECDSSIDIVRGVGMYQLIL